MGNHLATDDATTAPTKNMKYDISRQHDIRELKEAIAKERDQKLRNKYKQTLRTILNEPEHIKQARRWMLAQKGAGKKEKVDKFYNDVATKPETWQSAEYLKRNRSK